MTRENCGVASESFDEAWKRIRKSTASLAEAASEMKRWQREHGVPNPDILSRMPTQEEIDFEMQMMRWMDFLKAHGKEVGCRTQAERAEHRRLWPLFVAEELKRNPNASIPEWEN